MITEKDLQEAIAECEGERNPNANTCIKLAAFYTIQNHLFGVPETYSHAVSPAISAGTVSVEGSDTEFGRLVEGMAADDVIRVMDDLMSTLEIVQPRLYAGVIRKLAEAEVK